MHEADAHNTHTYHAMYTKKNPSPQKNKKTKTKHNKTPQKTKNTSQDCFVNSAPTNYSEDQNIWLAKIVVIVI